MRALSCSVVKMRGAVSVVDTHAGSGRYVLPSQVEVPAWRHAVINLPHPLLKRGLVVLDTPGLNAIGAEPELTVGLLPSAHATVFILGADTGVTRSDLAIWRDHLDAQGVGRYVVLNKIDTLVDPLSAPGVVEAQIARQCSDVAHTLNLPLERVFPLSARQALTARAAGDEDALAASRLPALEAALTERLLPQRRQMLAQVGLDGMAHIERQVSRRLTDRRRQVAEQLLELRGLRGKSSAKVRQMLQRVDAEAAEFEQCAARLQANYDSLEARIAELAAKEDLARVRPDLDGNAIMEILGIPAGPQVGEAWKYLKELRLDRGPLSPEEATAELLAWWNAEGGRGV
jgi:cell division protein FtsB